MKKTIILHGHLAEKFPDSITVEADTIAEALQALTQFQELSPPPGERWAVQVDGITTQEQLFEITDIEEIHVRPETGGAGGRGGIALIVIGIVMVAVALFAPQATVNIITDFKVVTKHQLQLPEVVVGVFACPNSNCISHREPVRSRFSVRSAQGEVRLKCHFCEKSFTQEIVSDAF